MREKKEKRDRRKRRGTISLDRDLMHLLITQGHRLAETLSKREERVLAVPIQAVDIALLAGVLCLRLDGEWAIR